MLQLLLAHASPAVLGPMREMLRPLLQVWITEFNPQGPPSTFRYPVPPLMQVLCTWHVRHPDDFRQQLQAMPGATAKVAVLLVAACRTLRSVPLRASALWGAVSLAEESGVDFNFWRE